MRELVKVFIADVSFFAFIVTVFVLAPPIFLAMRITTKLKCTKLNLDSSIDFTFVNFILIWIY